ncbi:MAG: hypothetical protein D6689_14435 [Deltaproteobacteria bacterium]|nr:MAG: hypothetical protein D6689_14435 [Deltaproteobacteria bacterium]
MPRTGALPIGDDTGILVPTPPPARRGPPAPPRPAGKAATRAGTGRHRAAPPAGGRSARREVKARANAARRGAGSASVAWLLLVAALGVGGLGGFYLMENWRAAEDALRDARSQVVAAEQRAAAAEQRAVEARAALTRERAAREELARQLAGATRRAAEADELAAKLQTIVGQQGTVTREDDKLTLEMVDKVLFRSGEAALTPQGERVLASVGEELKKFPEKQIWVQGHTDDVPIERAQFASNWELSTARALTVVHYLEDVAKIDPRRLAAVGFGEHRPISRSKKYRNRRIEIVLFPREVRLVDD